MDKSTNSRQIHGERFPPLVTPVRLRELSDAHEHALAHASEAGAGTIFHVGRFDQVEFALVLEPDAPLFNARRVLFAGMNALAETIAADCPPEREVHFGYPADLHFDNGLVGGMRIGWPDGADENTVPDWIVLSAIIRTGGFAELGFTLSRDGTTLGEAGFETVDPEAFTARFCRHFMAEIDDWQERGFQGIGQRYLARLPKAADVMTRGIDGNGDLMVQRKGEATARTPLLAGLEHPGWYEPESRSVRV
ncbi:MAG: biotin/lipoate--protein ligase family protein [Proteobacteria bacterium]|nr:biotin/lipoate--protein ligase family protein [Pseudomonadota bacterium]